MLAFRSSLNSQRCIIYCDWVLLQAQHRESHGRGVGPRPPPRVRRRRCVGVAHRQPLVEEGHDHLLRVGRELLEQRRRVRVGRLEQDLGGGAYAVCGLRRQGLRLEALCDVEEDLIGLLADGGVLPGELMLVPMLKHGQVPFGRGFLSRLGLGHTLGRTIGTAGVTIDGLDSPA